MLRGSMHPMHIYFSNRSSTLLGGACGARSLSCMLTLPPTWQNFNKKHEHACAGDTQHALISRPCRLAWYTHVLLAVLGRERERDPEQGKNEQEKRKIAFLTLPNQTNLADNHEELLQLRFETILPADLSGKACCR